MSKAGIWAMAAMLFFAHVAVGQEDVKPEDYKKLYEDTRVQLKAAQDRKSELADENAKLTAQVGELKKSQAADATEILDLKLQIAGSGEKTLFLRTHYATWLEFISIHPLVQMEWDVFLTAMTPADPTIQLPLLDPNWPLSANDR